MGMLDRYKKKGGFIQLLQLIETSGKVKQDQFLGLIAQESPAWEEHIRKKIITLDKILGWNAVYLSEIFSRLQLLTLASAFHGLSDDKVNLVLKAISSTDLRKFQITMQEINPTPAEKMTSQMKILTETRALISQGILKLDKIDPELIVHESIEEKLSESNFSSLQTINNEKSSPLQGNFLSNGSSQSDSKIELKESQKTSEKNDLKSSSSEANKEDVEFLRKKVNQLVKDNNMLKHEVSVLKNKLEQIRRIA
jgi:hypothetical protein